MTEPTPTTAAAPRHDRSPFRGAVLRGLGVVLPPLLTVAIFLWIGGTVQNYFLSPLSRMSESLLVAVIADVRMPQEIPDLDPTKPSVRFNGTTYQRLESGEYIPQVVYDQVRSRPSLDPIPTAGYPTYRAYVRLTYLRPFLLIPVLLAIFVLLLYALGKFMAAGIGRFFGRFFEAIIARLPLIRNVYSAVKQVSGFVLDQREMRVSRVVAVEYPRKGIWALGFVTGEGIPDIERLEGEPCLSVLICTSPMPMAGFTINVRRSSVVDLNITLDQAIQFIVSCGVVVPSRKGPSLPATNEPPRESKDELDGESPDAASLLPPCPPAIES